MAFLDAFFTHAQAVRQACAELGMQAENDLSDFSLRLRLQGREECWPARFLVTRAGQQLYSHQLAQGTTGFAGWMPYAVRQWPAGSGKSAFKRHALEHGIPTPAATRDPARIAGPFLVKPDRSSFGEGIRGPFARHDADDPAHALQEGEYYENFVVGLIAKAWCWGEECVALHLQRPSTVLGDGQSTVRQLVEALPNTRGIHDWDLVGRLAVSCGVDGIAAIPPPGREVLVEFRYGSRYDPPSFENPNLLPRLDGTPLAAQFAAAARACAAAIPPSIDQGESLFTLDAIVDRDGEALFLEMNCHPTVHPDVYAPMLRSRLSPTPRKKPAEAGSSMPVAA